MKTGTTGKEPEVFIEHISQCIDLIENYTNDVTIGDFFDSVQLQDSIIRRIEIIGALSAGLPSNIVFFTFFSHQTQNIPQFISHVCHPFLNSFIN